MFYRLISLAMMLVFFPFVSLVLLLYVGFCFYVFKSFKVDTSNTEDTLQEHKGVSILIPCRNEASRITQCLDAIAQQNGAIGPLEVIVIDDHSEDDTLKVVKQYASKFEIQVISANGTGKKAALETGIQLAQYPIIYTIDADCVMDTYCLSTMYQRYMSNDLNMLCGLVSYRSGATIFGAMQQAESVALVGISAFMLNGGRPATCNGANLMFSKALFNHLGGYGSDKQLSSGDDDLLMQSFAAYQPDKVKYANHPLAVVYTKTETTLKSFLFQRMRWAGKRSAYKFHYNSYLMALLLLKQMAFWMAFVAGTVFSSPLLYLVCLVLLMADCLLVIRFRQLLPLKWYTLLLMPFYQLYIPLILVLSLFVKVSWKGRAVVRG